MIMAGGEGKRLRPLTCDQPKPMARLCGRPVMAYILDLLEDSGELLVLELMDHGIVSWDLISLSFIKQVPPPTKEQFITC